MPTIAQLPTAQTVAASDLIPISQGGSVHSVSVGALLAQTQPEIIAPPQSLLGRFSIGPGGPDVISLGSGLTLNGGTLSSSGTDLTSLPVQTTLSVSDQIVVTNAGTPQLLAADQFRDLFTAGANITIDENGQISTADSAYSLTALSSVNALAAGDLVGVSKDGADHTITYDDLIDGVTIDEAQSAGPTADSDAFWVGQNSNNMVRQTIGELWPWVCGKLPSWKRPVIELSANTTLDGTVHNNAILVCSSPISISGVPADLGSGFTCDLINASTGTVTFSSNITSSNGPAGVATNQSASIQCVTYSGGTIIFALNGGGSST